MRSGLGYGNTKMAITAHPGGQWQAVTHASEDDLPWICPGSALLDLPGIFPWICPGSALDLPWIRPGSVLDPP